MKISTIMLAGAFIAYLLFLSCSEADKGNPDKEINVACKQSNFVASLEIPANIEPNCTGEGKKLIRISEMHMEEIDWDALGGSQSGSMTSGQYGSKTEDIYVLNGDTISKAEYEIRMEEYWKKYQELQKGKRDLDIPCVVNSDFMGWTALLTEEEANELLEKYGEILISDYQEYISAANEGSAGESRCGSILHY